MAGHSNGTMAVRRNSLYGLMGFGVPSLVMLVAYPVLIHHLGAASFGVYLLATSTSGTLAFLDFGMSAATLRFVAEDIARGEKKAAADIILTSVMFYGGIGSLGALLFWLLSPQLLSLFSVDATLRASALWAFRLASIQFAASFLSTVFISLFKGMQRFDLSTLALSLLSFLTYGGSVAGVLLAGLGLTGVTAISLSANLVVLGVSAAAGMSLCRAHGIALSAGRPSLSTLRRMFGFGAAMSVHNLTALFFSQAQRVLVGVLIGPAAVAVYVLATTVVAKAHQVIGAATEVMFPIASAMEDRKHLRRVYLHMLFGSGLLAALILLPLSVFSDPILHLWVGTEVAHKAARLMPIFAGAFFFVALSPAPFYVVNGLGKPWFNVAFDLINVGAAALITSILAIGGITLSGFAWAFAIANVVTGLAFQVSVEILIWRRGILSRPGIALPEGLPRSEERS